MLIYTPNVHIAWRFYSVECDEIPWYVKFRVFTLARNSMVREISDTQKPLEFHGSWNYQSWNCGKTPWYAKIAARLFPQQKTSAILDIGRNSLRTVLGKVVGSNLKNNYLRASTTNNRKVEGTERTNRSWRPKSSPTRGSKCAARSALKLRTNQCPKIRTLGTDRAIIKVKSSPWKASAYLSMSLRQVCLIHSESRVRVVNKGYCWPLATWMLLLHNKENSSAFSR